MFIVLAALVAAGLVTGSGNGPGARLGPAVLVLPTILTVGLLYVGARSTYLHKVVVTGVQIRYLAPFFGGLALAAAIVLERFGRRLARWLPVAALALVLGWDVATAYLVMDVNMSPNVPHALGRIHAALLWLIDWAAPPDAVTIAMLVLTACCAVAALVAFVRYATGEPKTQVSQSP
jgi:hypothetical protein